MGFLQLEHEASRRKSSVKIRSDLLQSIKLGVVSYLSFKRVLFLKVNEKTTR
ncbi:hypothetical protein HanIR_Chr08g0356701 [Helianthus annuus]|nr:hypothetical protein HanIR_Chr08g0356701 [Helianthus annuus]